MMTITLCTVVAILAAFAAFTKVREPNPVDKRVNRSLRRFADQGFATIPPIDPHHLRHSDFLNQQSVAAA
jgi:hypothetical protein